MKKIITVTLCIVLVLLFAGCEKNGDTSKVEIDYKDYIHFYCAVRSILFKLTKGDAPDIEQMNARVRKIQTNAYKSY